MKKLLFSLLFVNQLFQNAFTQDWIFNKDFPVNATPVNENFHTSFSLSVYPNPVQNILNIQTQEIIKEIAVYDVLGKKLAVSQVSTNSIDVSNLAQGMYIFKVMNDNDKSFSTKFIKE